MPNSRPTGVFRAGRSDSRLAVVTGPAANYSMTGGPIPLLFGPRSGESENAGRNRPHLAGRLAAGWPGLLRRTRRPGRPLGLGHQRPAETPESPGRAPENHRGSGAGAARARIPGVPAGRAWRAAPGAGIP